MTLSVENIQFKIIQNTDSGLFLEMVNDGQNKFYDGHFDEFKLLPALAQIHLCIEICKQKQMDVNYKKLTNLKFKTPIKPEEVVFLTIENKNSRISFKYTGKNPESIYSQGMIG